MVIVIEGADASGKSSLIAELQRALGEEAFMLHQGKPLTETRRWVLDEYAINASSIFLPNRDVIADRWHWGEVTYAPLKRSHTNKDGFGLLGISGWRWVELFLLSRGVAQFWLYQPLDVITSRLSSRGDDFVSVDELGQILDNYKFAAEHAADLAGIVTPDPHDIGALPSVADKMIEIARQRAAAAARLAKFPQYIGSLAPSVLLVGDKRNDKSITILPFMPIDSNSGEYLLSCLPHDFWKTVGIVNGDDLHGKPLQMLWSAIGSPKIIALGRMAEKKLKQSGFSEPQYSVVPHPQYVRRFHHHDRDSYGKAIEDIALNGEKEGDPWILP